MLKSIYGKLAAVSIALLIFTGCTTQNVQGAQDNAVPEQVEATWCVKKDTEVCYAPLKVSKGKSAYVSLEELDAREESFSFKSTDYGAEMGYFVNEVNGVAADASNFWALLVNDQDATTGISQIKLNENTKLTFSYEKIEL